MKQLYCPPHIRCKELTEDNDLCQESGDPQSNVKYIIFSEDETVVGENGGFAKDNNQQNTGAAGTGSIWDD